MCFALVPPHLNQSRTSYSVLMCQGNVTRTAQLREQACEELAINRGKEKIITVCKFSKIYHMEKKEKQNDFRTSRYNL